MLRCHTIGGPAPALWKIRGVKHFRGTSTNFPCIYHLKEAFKIHFICYQEQVQRTKLHMERNVFYML
jgi:hypothetical protein